MQRCLCQASVFFAWNTETGQHRIIDYDLPVEIATISTQNQSLSTRLLFPFKIIHNDLLLFSIFFVFNQ